MKAKKYLLCTTLIFIFFCLILTAIFIFLSFQDFGNDHVRSVTNTLFYIAFWPSIFLRLYPHAVTPSGKIVYDMLGWIYPWIFMINVLCWGGIGFITGVIFLKIKEMNHNHNKQI